MAMQLSQLSHSGKSITHNMYTHSSPSQTCGSPPQTNRSDSDKGSQISGNDSVVQVNWLPEDEATLISFLISKKDKGNGGFKPSLWTAAAEHMKPLTKKGGPKTPDKCKGKWTRVCAKHCCTGKC